MKKLFILFFLIFSLAVGGEMDKKLDPSKNILELNIGDFVYNCGIELDLEECMKYKIISKKEEKNSQLREIILEHKDNIFGEIYLGITEDKKNKKILITELEKITDNSFILKNAGGGISELYYDKENGYYIEKNNENNDIYIAAK